MQTTIETYVGQRDFLSFARVNEKAQEVGHAYWIGDIPVSKQLLEFFKALKIKRYNIVPCIDFAADTVWPTDSTPYSMYSKIGITYTNATDFRSGVIFIDKNSKTGDTEFCVNCASIENDKFAIHSEGYHIRKSKDMAKMLKVALKHLVPATFESVQNGCTGALNSGLYGLRSPAKDKWDDHFRLQREDVLEEIEHMVAIGYVPRTLAFKKVVDLIAREGAELKRMREYKPRACFVWVKSDSLTYKFTEDYTETECTDPTQVPEFIRNKISILQIAKDGDAITDIGVRVSATTYWVFA